jgi:hypothetical protein
MVIDQRNAGASLSATTTTFGVDRWQTYASANSKYTTQQNAGSVTPPVGFTNYLGVTSSSAYSSATGDVFSLLQNIEGFNVADLGFGTANAKTLTLSFWVRSSLTGTFGGSLTNNGYNRAYPFSYTISTANTWEQKSITIAGDVTGTWTTDNSAGIRLYIDLGSGSIYQGTAGSWGGMKTTVTGATSVVGTNGATFYITGVQLEVGTQATSFEYRQYGTELALCQRYLPAFNATSSSDSLGLAQAYATNACLLLCNFPTQSRVPATGISVSSASHFGGWRAASSSAGVPTAVAFNRSGVNSAFIDISGWSNATLAAGNAMGVFWQSASGQLLFTGCEL